MPGINPQAFPQARHGNKDPFSFFSTFQTLDCSISKNVQTNPCGFIRESKEGLLNKCVKFYCNTMIQTAETIIGKRPVSQVSPECRFFEIQRTILARHYGKIFSFALSSSYTKLFQTHTLYQGGLSLPPPPPPPTISSTRSCTSVKFCRALEIPFKVSESYRVVENLLYGWLPWQLFDNMVFFANNCQNVYEKQVIFKYFQKPQISRCQNKTLCNDSSIPVLFKTII